MENFHGLLRISIPLCSGEPRRPLSHIRRDALQRRALCPSNFSSSINAREYAFERRVSFTTVEKKRALKDNHVFLQPAENIPLTADGSRLRQLTCEQHAHLAVSDHIDSDSSGFLSVEIFLRSCVNGAFCEQMPPSLGKNGRAQMFAVKRAHDRRKSQSLRRRFEKKRTFQGRAATRPASPSRAVVREGAIICAGKEGPSDR